MFAQNILGRIFRYLFIINYMPVTFCHTYTIKSINLIIFTNVTESGGQISFISGKILQIEDKINAKSTFS